MIIWNILWPFGIHMYFMVNGNVVIIWYILHRFGIMSRKIWQPGLSQAVRKYSTYVGWP
jgi:hypothetical protein